MNWVGRAQNKRCGKKRACKGKKARKPDKMRVQPYKPSVEAGQRENGGQGRKNPLRGTNPLEKHSYRPLEKENVGYVEPKTIVRGVVNDFN